MRGLTYRVSSDLGVVRLSFDSNADFVAATDYRNFWLAFTRDGRLAIGGGDDEQANLCTMAGEHVIGLDYHWEGALFYGTREGALVQTDSLVRCWGARVPAPIVGLRSTSCGLTRSAVAYAETRLYFLDAGEASSCIQHSP
jgi:hypothetical protein